MTGDGSMGLGDQPKGLKNGIGLSGSCLVQRLCPFANQGFRAGCVARSARPSVVAIGTDRVETTRMLVHALSKGCVHSRTKALGPDVLQGSEVDRDKTKEPDSLAVELFAYVTEKCFTDISPMEAREDIVAVVMRPRRRSNERRSKTVGKGGCTDIGRTVHLCPIIAQTPTDSKCPLQISLSPSWTYLHKIDTSGHS
ncbi:hypothetical protein DY000_02031814 [Brassica cretica]|uniref:Uncharacterized protein n=1 Tax=Brassica cretica TaxID=69181 RepID=A0ABQ7DTQ8_BRACR|nr:hypothetical protein DY000_02031814 [Brassica cretica]